MKKIIILFSVFCSLLFVSCSDNDDYENEINEQISISRTDAICSLLNNVALYPDDEIDLDNAAGLSLVSFDPSNIQDEKTEGENRGKVMSALFESMSVNIDATALLSVITEKYIGAYSSNAIAYNSKSEFFSDNTIKIARAYSTGSYISAIANKSDSEIALFKAIAQKFLGYYSFE